MKQEHGIMILLGLGGAAVLFYLWYESKNADLAAATKAPPPASNENAVARSYPGGTPLNPNNFVVGGSPLNLTYNTFPPNYSATGSEVAPLDSFCGNGGCNGCGESCDSCCQTQQPVTYQMISKEAVSTATANLNAFIGKLPKAAPPVAGTVRMGV